MSSSTSSVKSGASAGAPPTLEELVTHLLAAKRSLSSVEHVSHAKDLATSTRRNLEDHTVLASRTFFLWNGCKAQIAVLEQVRDHTQSIAFDSGIEYSTVIRNLNAADSELESTVARLRATVVESSLRPNGEEPKSLADFVDESGPQGLLDTIKQSVEASGQGRRDYEHLIGELDGDIAHVTKLLTAGERLPGLESFPERSQSPVPEVLQKMDEWAQEMASNLESLVKHFDLCVTAIKHTEGGGAAAFGIINDLPEGVDLHLSEMDGAMDPISEEEKKDMLHVLRKDSTEVDEVVNEVKDRIADMDTEYERVTEYSDTLIAHFECTSKALKLLEEIGHRLPSYLTQSQVFLLHWDEEKLRIEEHMEELEGLREFYAGFLTAYDQLVIEVGRRKDTERRIRKVRQEALAKIDEMLAEEDEERHFFRQSHGEFLPVDIWPGLSVPPPRYDFAIVEGEVDSVPDISASIINKAIRRLGATQKSSLPDVQKPPQSMA